MTYLSLPALKSIEQTNNKENEKQVKKERCDLAFEEAWQNYEQEPILVTDWFFFFLRFEFNLHYPTWFVISVWRVGAF